MIHRFSRFALLFALVACPLTVRAQVDSGNEIPEVTRTYALVGAQVVQAPGRVLDKATVIVRDGLIAEVGSNVDVPFDAHVIEADSLIIYAGFIAGLSHAGIPTPKEEARPERPDNPGYPPDTEAGILPGRDVRTLLKSDDKSITDLRNIGFTAAHVVPRGRMLPGTGAIILLSGESINKSVFSGETSLFAQLASARRMYPGTDMAVIAKMRQLFRESARRQRLEQLYASDPTGIPRPEYDPTHYALFPVLTEEKPVFFHTEDALDVHRALSLHQELQFSMVLTGVNQGFEVLDKLKAAGVPLLITLELPESKRKKEDDSEAEPDSTEIQPTDVPVELPEVPLSTHNPALRVTDYTDIEAEKTKLEARRDAERERYLTYPASLESEGFEFGFSTLDTPAKDILANVQLMVENGLSENSALAALTTNPASILGVSASMGTVDEGKMGNLVVTSGNLFDEESKIRYVFIDGRMFEMEAERETPEGDSDAVVDAAGQWSIIAHTPDGEIGGTLILEADLTGTITLDVAGDAMDVSSAELDGNELSFSFSVSGMGAVSVTVIIDGDTFAGEASPDFAETVSFSGTRTSGPER